MDLRPRSLAFQSGCGVAEDCDKAHEYLAEALRSAEPTKKDFLYRQAIGICPSSPETHYKLSLLLKEQGNARDAAAEVKQALALKDDPSFPPSARAQSKSERGDLKGAEQDYLQTTKRDPNN